MDELKKFRKYSYSTPPIESDDESNLFGTFWKTYKLASALGNLAGSDKLTNKLSEHLYNSGLGSFSGLIPRLIPRQAEVNLSGILGMPKKTSLTLGNLPTQALEGNPRGAMFKMPWDFLKGGSFADWLGGI